LALALGEQAVQSAQATQAAQATQLAATVLNGAAGVQGEPDVVQLPPDTAGTAATGQSSSQNSAPPILLIPPTPTAVPPLVQAQASTGGAASGREGNIQTVGGLRLFDRPLNDVLLWGGIMLGIPALIVLLGTLIWLASKKNQES
jgi:hypothetical protein